MPTWKPPLKSRALAFSGGLLALLAAPAGPGPALGKTSYAPVNLTEPFADVRDRMTAAKAQVMARQLALLKQRYDLGNHPASGVTMSRGKPVQEGVRVKLPAGCTWEKLGTLAPAGIMEKDLFPLGFLPLPHPNHPEGGMVFPRFHINEILRQENRDLTRFDLDFDLPDHFLPEFPASVYLTTRPDLGDVSQGKVITIDTPSLRGVNIQRLFGSQRALKTVEDFTEFEQRAAYFDGDPVTATKKGVNVLDRGSQVHDMAEFQELLDFPPAPKLKVDGTLDPRLASAAERRGQALFFGKAACATCHPAPFYTDNLMHDLKTERFYRPRAINAAMACGDGPIKTSPLRGVKDSPPYLHDGRLLTLDDTVEFFNLVLELKLNAQEKRDLVAFLQQL